MTQTSSLDVINIALNDPELQFLAGDDDLCNIQLRDFTTDQPIINIQQQLITLPVFHRDILINCEQDQGFIQLNTEFIFISDDLQRLIPTSIELDADCDNLKVFRNQFNTNSTRNEIDLNEFETDIVLLCENIEMFVNLLLAVTTTDTQFFLEANQRLSDERNANDDLNLKIQDVDLQLFELLIENLGRAEQFFEQFVINLLAAPFLLPLFEAIELNDEVLILETSVDLFNDFANVLSNERRLDDKKFTNDNTRVLQDFVEQLLDQLNVNEEELAEILNVDEDDLQNVLNQPLEEALTAIDANLGLLAPAFGDITVGQVIFNFLELDLQNPSFDELILFFNPLRINLKLFENLNLLPKFQILFDIFFENDIFPNLTDFFNEFVNQLENRLRAELNDLFVRDNDGFPDALQLLFKGIAQLLVDYQFLDEISELNLTPLSQFFEVEQTLLLSDGRTFNIELDDIEPFAGRFRFNQGDAVNEIDVIITLPTIDLRRNTEFDLDFDVTIRNADGEIDVRGDLDVSGELSLDLDLVGAFAIDFTTLDLFSFFKAVDAATFIQVSTDFITCFVASTGLLVGQKVVSEIDFRVRSNDKDVEDFLNATFQLFEEGVPTILENLVVDSFSDLFLFLDDDNGVCADNVDDEVDEDNLGTILGVTFGTLATVTGLVGFIAYFFSQNRKSNFQQNLAS